VLTSGPKRTFLKGVPERLKSRTLSALQAMNDPENELFEPSIFNSVDYRQINWTCPLNKWILRPYINYAQSIVRVETDVVILTHILLYFSTSLPSAIVLLFYKFSWTHGMLHFIMQASYLASYTLMRHQHIHMRGVLRKRYALFDQLFPYIIDPLMGHTWNSYYYHHVKHHHVEGNGPDDLSSTVRYQRDDLSHFLHYMARFLFLIWFDLPRYFWRKGKASICIRMAFWELGNYAMWYLFYQHNARATICVFLLPMVVLRIGMMAGNWGQHAFVDELEPNSDYRSSVTVIDAQVSQTSQLRMSTVLVSYILDQSAFV
jgi:hypothetical protein